MGPKTTHPGRVITTLAALFLTTTALAANAANKPHIIATLFPQYDFARQIAGDKANIHLLLSPGTESHSFEPTPADMKNIASADLFIYTGKHMEPWAKRLADSTLGDKSVRVVDASKGIALIRNDNTKKHEHDKKEKKEAEAEEEEDHSEHNDHDGHFHEFDPHIWLDPVYAIAMANTIAEAIIANDPDNAAFYRANADRLCAELDALHREFQTIVENSPRRTLVFGERFAFAYLFSRYGLKEVGAYASCSPGTEPGLRAVIQVVDYARANEVRYIYLEAMSTGRISRVVQEETGAEILEVDSLHSLSAQRLRAGTTFQTAMRANMDAFAKGLQ